MMIETELRMVSARSKSVYNYENCRDAGFLIQCEPKGTMFAVRFKMMSEGR